MSSTKCAVHGLDKVSPEDFLAPSTDAVLGFYECLFVGPMIAITLVCVALQYRLGMEASQQLHVERARDQAAFTAAFAAALVAAVGCTIKAVSTSSKKKAALATRLAVHAGAVSFAMLCCAVHAVWIPVGKLGHSINIVAQSSLFLTTSSMAQLFHKMAYYSVGAAAEDKKKKGPLLIAAVALCREAATIAALFQPQWLVPLLLVVVGGTAASVALKLWIMAPYFQAAAVAPGRRVMIMNLFLIFAAMIATDVTLLAYAGGLTDAVVCDYVVCACITTRILLLYVRCTYVMMFNDERAMAIGTLSAQRVALQEQHEQQLNRFYNVIFHELRVPLNSIVLGLDMAHAKVDQVVEADGMQPEADTIDMLRESAHTMITLLSDLLDIAKIETRALVLQSAPLSLEAVQIAAVRQMTPLAAAMHVHLFSTVAVDVPATLIGDSVRLAQIMRNFASNAVKFCPQDGSGEVQLRVSRVPEVLDDDEVVSVELACIDNGPGISKEDVDRLFKPFSQLQNAADATAIRGSGLGLAICAQLAELHGGRIGCTSELGRGSKFFAVIPLRRAGVSPASELKHEVQLLDGSGEEDESTDCTPICTVPLTQNKEAAKAEAPAPPALPRVEPDTRERSATRTTTNPAEHGPSESTGLRVLVVDDDATNRLLLCRALRKRLPTGCVIEQCGDGLQALAETEAAGFDVICFDGRMPRMGGKECAQELRARGVSSLILGCTGDTEEHDVQEFIDAGADAVISKPISIDAVLQHIRGKKLP